MNLRRIGWPSTARLIAALASLAPAAWAASGPLALENPDEGIFVHLGAQADASAANGGDIANIGFVVGSRCVAVIDSGGSAAIGAALLAAIRERTDRPVCYVIHTHVHPDHGFGDSAFASEPVEFVGHAAFPAALAARRSAYRAALGNALGTAADGSDIVVPTVLVSDALTLDIGDRRLELRAWPTAHTNHDLTVYDPRTRTLWTGDLVFVDRIPVVDGKALGWLGVMDALAAMKPAHLVPGHGPLDRPVDIAIGAQKKYLHKLITECRSAIRNGATLARAVDTIGFDEKKDWLLFDEYHRRNVTAVFTELEWEE